MSATIKKKPFPYLIINNFLNKKKFNNLSKKFPNYLFNNIKNNVFRNNIHINHPDFVKFLNNEKEWTKFIESLTGKKFVNYLLKLFKNDFKKFDLNISLDKTYQYLSYNFDRSNLNIISKIKIGLKLRFFTLRNLLLRILGIISIRIDVQCARSKSGYSLRPHTDQRSKVIVVLFYLNDMRDARGRYISNLNLYKNKSNDPKTWTRHPKKNETTKFKSVHITKNKIIIMLNSKNAYHGVDKFKSKNYRKFIYLSLSVANYKNIWN